MFASHTQFLTIGNRRLAYDDTGGNGPLIVALPGMGDLRSEYRRLSPILQGAGYRVVTIDVRGFGETTAQWDDYSARAVGSDALAIIRHLDAGPAVILGNSFAAGSALWTAQDAPASVTGIVMLGPIVRDLPVPWYASLLLKIGFAGPWRNWFWRTYWDSLFPSRKPDDHEQVKEALVNNLREPGRMDALIAMLGLSKADTAAIIPKNQVPTLVVMGSRDPDFPDPTAEARRLAAELKGNYLMVDGAGHYPHTEMPEQISARLLQFLGQAHALGVSR